MTEVTADQRVARPAPGVAGTAATSHNGAVPSWGSFSYAFGPLVAIATVAVLALVLRWGSRRGQSVVAAPPRPGPPEAYGMLVPVAAPRSAAEADRIERTLAAGGVPATVASTTAGLRVLVWPRQESAARRLLGQPPS